MGCWGGYPLTWSLAFHTPWVRMYASNQYLQIEHLGSLISRQLAPNWMLKKYGQCCDIWNYMELYGINWNYMCLIWSWGWESSQLQKWSHPSVQHCELHRLRTEVVLCSGGSQRFVLEVFGSRNAGRAEVVPRQLIFLVGVREHIMGLWLWCIIRDHGQNDGIWGGDPVFEPSPGVGVTRGWMLAICQELQAEIQIHRISQSNNLVVQTCRLT